jgi:hypothetical protein
VRLTVHVHPRASLERRTWDGTRLELWVRQPPVDGAATAAAVDEVARWLGVPRRAVQVVTGNRGRTKILEIDGISVLPPADAPPYPKP